MLIGSVTANLFLETLYNQRESEQIYETAYIIISNDRDQVIYSLGVEDITSLAVFESVKLVKEKGINDYILKPLNKELLLSKILRHLGQI